MISKDLLSMVKKTFLIVVGMTALLYATGLDDVKKLELRGEYRLAREKLENELDSSNQIQYYQVWMQIDEALYRKLQQKSTIKELTKFIPPEKWSWKKWVAVGGGAVVGGALIFFTAGAATPAVCALGAACAASTVGGVTLVGGGAIVGGAATAGALKFAENGQEKADVNFYLTDIFEAKDTLKKYNILKESQKKLRKHIEEYILNTSKTENNILHLLKNQNNFIKSIKKSYVDYISYTLISPYLAYADYHIYLANDHWFWHDYDELKKAAQAMANGAYKDILLECNEDVKEQFYDVYQKLKSTASEKELQDLKVLQSLMDNVSNKKKSGIDLWWP